MEYKQCPLCGGVLDQRPTKAVLDCQSCDAAIPYGLLVTMSAEAVREIYSGLGKAAPLASPDGVH